MKWLYSAVSSSSGSKVATAAADFFKREVVLTMKGNLYWLYLRISEEWSTYRLWILSFDECLIAALHNCFRLSLHIFCLFSSNFGLRMYYIPLMDSCLVSSSWFSVYYMSHFLGVRVCSNNITKSIGRAFGLWPQIKLNCSLVFWYILSCNK